MARAAVNPEAGHQAGGMVSNDPITVRVEHNARRWQVTLPDESRRVTSEIFDDAHRIAYVCAVHPRPRELIAHDSCRRWLRLEPIDGHDTPPETEKEKVARHPTASSPASHPNSVRRTVDSTAPPTTGRFSLSTLTNRPVDTTTQRSMSTTLVPPSRYLVQSHGRPPRLYNTLPEVAAAIYLLAPRPATVSAMTGSRRRSLTDAELHDLGQAVRSLRLDTRSTSSAVRRRARL